MAVISAFGTENAASQTECHGDYHNYTQVTHEARARRERGDVLTVVSRITRLNHTAFLGQNPVEYLYEERIGAWRPTDGVVTEMYGVLDYFDPIQVRFDRSIDRLDRLLVSIDGRRSAFSRSMDAAVLSRARLGRLVGSLGNTKRSLT